MTTKLEKKKKEKRDNRFFKVENKCGHFFFFIILRENPSPWFHNFTLNPHEPSSSSSSPRKRGRVYALRRGREGGREGGRGNKLQRLQKMALAWSWSWT